ncbi:MAG: DUF748 domain-containing protein [Bacteroidales bacterium]|jgi:hypothetical protein|nr:DUF748 domain-containing protein [Bacteroidales bacterium]
MKKKLLLRILIILAGLIMACLIILPGLARKYVVDHGKELLGRKISINRIKLNYFTSTVRIIGFKMFEADEKETFVSFDLLKVNLQPLNLVRNELVIEQVLLEGFFANIIQQDSTFNFDDLVAFHTADADSTENDTTPSEPLQFRVSNIELKQSNFIFDDRKVNKSTHLRDFSLFVPLIAWNQEDQSEAGMKFTFANGGYFESSLRIDPVEGDYRADIAIQNLRLDAFQEYMSYYSGIDSIHGIFNTQLRLQGNIKRFEESLVSGRTEIRDIVLTDPQGIKFLGAEKIHLGIKNIDYAHSRYEIDSLILTGPYVHFILGDSTDNLSEMFSYPMDETTLTDEAVSGTAAIHAADTVYFSLDAFMIRNGVVDYTDNLTGEPFNYHLSRIELQAGSITSDAGWIDLYSSMLLNDRGTLEAKVGLDPADPVKNISLDYVISGFLLSDLNIYSRFYMGFPILLGDMYYKSETRITEGQLTSENKLVMTDVELGKKGGGLYDIPVKLALFILKDRNGVINLDVPVRGDLNDPRVKLGKIIWNTFKNLIVKVATAPFDILAGSIGADPKDLEMIEFDFMDTTLTAGRKNQLDLLLKLEQEKAGLEIEMVYFNDRKLEGEIISQESGISDEAAIRQYLDLLEDSRFGIMKRYLHSVNDSTSVSVVISSPQDPKNLGTRPVFRINYSMKEE